MDYPYDIETFPNVFTCAIKQANTAAWWLFEISTRRNDLSDLISTLDWLRCTDGRMVGFNNFGFDWPVLDFIMRTWPTAEQIYRFATNIISSDDRFSHIVWQPAVTQLDLYKIHHFDNMAKATGLKMLEFNMRSDNIQELPFEPGTILTDQQIDELIEYNCHDVSETEKFYNESQGAIKFREELGPSSLNHNDTKIGKEYFISELEMAAPGTCFELGTRRPRQTLRQSISVGNILVPYIAFERPELQQMHRWFAAQNITETKGVFKNLNCTVDGFTFHFGAGGIHGSVEAQTVTSDDHTSIIDLDVTSYYPSLAIVNRFHPEHLGELFCDIYADLKKHRVGYVKGTKENKVLKLALNGTFGDTNNKYSPFYDPQCTMAITINGQLLLCMLSEMLMRISGLRMIQANTDGVTVECPNERITDLGAVCNVWQYLTGLELERADYSRMFIRDVNNYLAEYQSGKVKRKGVYEYELAWHQNHSALVVPKAAEAALLHGVDIDGFIRGHDDIMDFMLRTKVPRAGYLLHGKTRVQNISRYYVSHGGECLTKMLPPTKKKPDHWRPIGINVGQFVTICNDIRQADRAGINYDWYISEARKLVEVVR